MDINNSENLIFKLSTITNEQLSDVDVTFHLVRKQNEADSLYQTLEVQLAPDVKEWVRKSIINSLKELKQTDDNNNHVFYVGDYNHEISMNDKIAKFALSNAILILLHKHNINTHYPRIIPTHKPF